MGIGLSGLSGIAGIGGEGGHRPSPQQSYTPQPPISSFGGGSGGSLGGLSQLGQAISLGKVGAGLAGNTDLAGSLGAAGGVLGAGQSAYNILRGDGSPSDYLSLASKGKNLYDLYGASQAGAGAAGGAGAAEAAGAGAAGGEGALSGMSSVMGYAGPAMAVMAAMQALGDVGERGAKEGGYRTFDRLRSAGIPQNELLSIFQRGGDPNNPTGSLYTIDPAKAQAMLARYPGAQTDMHDLMGNFQAVAPDILGGDTRGVGGSAGGLARYFGAPAYDAKLTRTSQQGADSGFNPYGTVVPRDDSGG